MKKILILINGDVCAYNLRKEIVHHFLSAGCEVYLSLPYGSKVELFKAMGCKFIETYIENRGTNPLRDIKLFAFYNRIIKDLRPDLVLSYTIKPTIYGGLACRLNGVPYIANITGLGTAVENPSALQRFIVMMYRTAMRGAHCIFFQNEENKKFFSDHAIAGGKHRLLPGSGVNLREFKLMEYPNDDVIRFLFIGRIMKEKGIEQYLEAASIIREKHPNTVFYILGGYAEDYSEQVAKLEAQGIVKFCGMQADIRPFLKESHCTIHPTYYPEGMSNALLETEACGRPVITTRRSGCRETVEENQNGYLFDSQDTAQLVEKIEQFLTLSYEEKREMGLAARRKMEREFDRQIVVDAYIEEAATVFGRETEGELKLARDSVMSMMAFAAKK